MSILIDAGTKVICRASRAGRAPSRTVAGLRHPACGRRYPGQGGTTHLGLPVFDTVKDAVAATGATASVIPVPAPSVRIRSGGGERRHRAIVCITEGIPTLDMLEVKARLDEMDNVRLIGPNCPGSSPPAPARSASCPAPFIFPGRWALSLAPAPDLRGGEADHG